MRITKIAIRNYRGVASIEQIVPPGGLVARGTNGRGKSSFINAVKAALTGRDIGPDAIRLGEDKAEILIDMESLAVRRVIEATRGTLTVTSGEGMRAQRPVAFLAELLGTSTLDPLDLLLDDPKRRRARVLEALPLTVTADELRVFAPDVGDIDTAGHGLEVIARVERDYYARRAAAKKARDVSERGLEPLRSAAAAAATGVPPLADGLEDLDVAGASSALASRRDAFSKLEAEAAAAQRAHERLTGARERLAEARRTAAESRAYHSKLIANGERLPNLREGEGIQANAVRRLERDLAVAKENLLRTRDAIAAVEGDLVEAKRVDVDAAKAEAMIRDVEAHIAETSAETVAPEALAAAREGVERAAEALARANAIETCNAAIQRHREATAWHAVAEVEVERLDGIVRALQRDAPAALLARADVIPGLGLDGDEITLDGVRLGSLCGAQAMRFCVSVAKRLNAKARILVVDGLERIDPDLQQAFKAFAVEGGYQLLASCVDRGEIVYEAVEASEDVAA